MTNEAVSPPAASLSVNAEFALKKAEAVARAIEKKFENKYKVRVRLIETTEYSFIELGINKPNDTPLNEKQVAYSQAFFEAMTTAEITQQRAQRILREIKVHLGVD